MNELLEGQEVTVKLGLVDHTYNLNSWEAEAGRWPQVPGQPGLHSLG